MRVELTYCPDNWYDLVANAARVSHMSNGTQEENRVLVGKLMKMGHLSPLRHAVVQFSVSEISRACGRQFLRHKFFDYVELSQRYVDVSGQTYTLPDSMDGDCFAEFVGHINKSKELYRRLINIGVPKEDARMVLPESLHTSFMVSASFQSLFDFFKLRMEEHAQWEIRELANEMWNIMSSIAPEVFSSTAYRAWVDGLHKRIYRTFPE